MFLNILLKIINHLLLPVKNFTSNFPEVFFTVVLIGIFSYFSQCNFF